MGVVTSGNQELPAPVSIEIGHEYGLLDAETGIDYELFETVAGGTGGATEKYKKTERENTHDGQYNSRLLMGHAHEDAKMTLLR